MEKLFPGKKKRPKPKFRSLWQREKDSNPHKQSQSLSCYPYTIPLFITRCRKNNDYYTEKWGKVKGENKSFLDF